MTEKTSAIPVILDTDIGSDIDDTWALAMMLRSPELDVKLVTAATGDTTFRAKIVARMLDIAGRTDVPVGVGIAQPVDGSPGAQEPWVSDYDLADYPGRVCADGVGALIDAIMMAPEPVTLIAIGPLPNIAAALDREPRIAERTRLVGMHGSVGVGYGGSDTISAEYNVAADVPACRKVFAADWRGMVITPLDTCGLVQLRGDKYRAVADCRDPLTRAVIENYHVWLAAKPDAQNPPEQSSVLFDTVAVYLAFATDLLVTERIGLRIDDKGYTLEDPSAPQLTCATAWRDLPAFEDLLVQRLTEKP